MIKRQLYLLFLFLACAGCSERVDKIEYIEFDNDCVVFQANGGELFIYPTDRDAIVDVSEATISPSFGVSSFSAFIGPGESTNPDFEISNEWLTVVFESARSDGRTKRIRLSATINETLQERKATVTFNAAALTSGKFYVTQNAK